MGGSGGKAEAQSQWRTEERPPGLCSGSTKTTLIPANLQKAQETAQTRVSAFPICPEGTLTEFIPSSILDPDPPGRPLLICSFTGGGGNVTDSLLCGTAGSSEEGGRLSDQKLCKGSLQLRVCSQIPALPLAPKRSRHNAREGG